MREHDVERRPAAGAAALEQRGLEPAAMLVASFEIHDRIFAAIDLALNACKAREMHGVFQHERMRRAGIEPDVADVADLLPLFVDAGSKTTLAGAVHVPGVCTSL